MNTNRRVAIWLSRQRWLSFKTRRSLIKRLYPDMLMDFAFESDFFGMRFAGNVATYIDRYVYFCGAHEKYMLFFLRDYVGRLRGRQSCITFVDVGANAGNHTLFMSKLVNEVHAFEPFERVRLQLTENLSRNHIDNVRLYPFGLSDRETVLPFYAAPDDNLGKASFCKSHEQENYYVGDIQLKRGDDVLADVGRVDIIKADVEGFEKYVLQGLQNTIARCRPLLIVELTPTTRESLAGEAALYALFPPDYRFYYFAQGSHDSGRYLLKPFDYALHSKIEDVIACPQEKVIHLGVP